MEQYKLIMSLPVAKSSTGRFCLRTASALLSDPLTGSTGVAQRPVTALSASLREWATASSLHDLSAHAASSTSQFPGPEFQTTKASETLGRYTNKDASQGLWQQRRNSSGLHAASRLQDRATAYEQGRGGSKLLWNDFATM